MIVRNLVEAFESDVKMRVVRGKVQEHLTTWEKNAAKADSRQPPLPPPPPPFVKPDPVAPPAASNPKHVPEIHSEAHLPLPTHAPTISALKGGLGNLSFAKRHKKQNGVTPPVRQRSTSRFSSEAPSESSALHHDHSGGEDGPGSRHRDDRVKKKKRDSLSNKGRKPARIASESEASDDERVKQQRRKEEKRQRAKAKEKAAKRGKVHLAYTSSEGDDDDDTPEVAEPPMLSFEDIVSRSTSPELNMQPIEVYRRTQDTVKEEEDDEDEPEPQFMNRLMGKNGVPSPLAKADNAMDIDDEEESSAAPTRDPTRSPSLHGPDDSEDEQPLSPATIKANRLRAASNLPPRPVTSDPFEAGVAADEEDLFYLKLALERLQLGHDFQPTPPTSDDEATNLKHPSGCARTEGLYKITIEEKMANRPASNRAKAATENSAAAQQASAVAVSRLARANTRGLVRGMELHKKVMATDTDVLKFNQLKTRKKQLTFSRSGIEGYGLFAKE